MELKSLDNALSLLAEFSAATPLLGVREMSARTGLAPSVVQRMLATYTRHGFLRQCSETRKYRLGVRFWELGTLFRGQYELTEGVEALMREAAAETGETVYLNMLEEEHAVCVQLAESTESVKVAIRLGERTPLLAGSRGRVLLAHMPAERQAAILAGGFAEQPAAEAEGRRRALAEGLATVREAGWCRSHGERLSDVVGLSAPIFDRRGAIFASVTIGGPSGRMTEEKVARCLPLLLALAQALQTHFRKFG